VGMPRDVNTVLRSMFNKLEWGFKIVEERVDVYRERSLGLR
jgi:hypothetical protein